MSEEGNGPLNQLSTGVEQHAKRKPSRKERELEFRKNIVIDAAEEVFAERSYADASVEDIAEQAEISVGTLYNLFRSKEEIYNNVVSRSMGMFFERIGVRVADAHGPRDKVRAAVGYYIEHFDRYGRQMRFYASATNGFQWDLKSKLSEGAQLDQNRFLRTLVVICQDGIDEGVFKSGVPAQFLALTLVGIPHAFLMAWLEQEAERPLLDLLPDALKIADRIIGTDE